MTDQRPGDNQASNSYHQPLHKDNVMFYWAFIFFLIAIVAAIFGFGGIANESAYIGKIIAVIGIILAIISFIFSRRSTRD
jgi:uncharacterized membrane protein YtjA (UPF0391 family)